MNYFKELNMKSLCIQTIWTCNISWQLVFWIDTKFDVKFDGHCFCFDSNLSSHITLGTNNGNLMCCPIACTSCSRKEMQPTSNNVMSFSNLNIFDFKFVGNFWWHNLFLSNSWKFWKKNSFAIGVQGQLRSHDQV